MKQPRSDADADLPRWFRRPTLRSGYQPSLFPEVVRDVLARLKVSPDELTRWHQDEWISFDLESAPLLEPVHVGEIIFVRDVVRSGLPDAVLRALFEQLPHPLAVNPDRIAFSFTHGWVLPAFTSEPDPGDYVDSNVESWLDQLAEEGETARLIELQERIEQLLASSAAPGE